MSAPIARTRDPQTSHQATRHITGTGARAAQQQMAQKAVEQYPGLTSLELAQRTTLCRFMLARRLPEIEPTGAVRRGQARRCSKSGRMAATWYPPKTIEQLGLFCGERAA